MLCVDGDLTLRSDNQSCADCCESVMYNGRHFKWHPFLLRSASPVVKYHLSIGPSQASQSSAGLIDEIRPNLHSNLHNSRLEA